VVGKQVELLLLDRVLNVGAGTAASEVTTKRGFGP